MTNEEAIIWLNTDDYASAGYGEALAMAIKALESQPCGDAIPRDKVLNMLADINTEMSDGEFFFEHWYSYIEKMPPVKPQQGWIPIKTRPMTEEEKEEIEIEYAYMYDCLLPDDGQDVLITDRWGNVEVDTFCDDYYGCYFETNCDDDEVIAWMPLPEPMKKENQGVEAWQPLSESLDKSNI